MPSPSTFLVHSRNVSERMRIRSFVDIMSRVYYRRLSIIDTDRFWKKENKTFQLPAAILFLQILRFRIDLW